MILINSCDFSSSLLSKKSLSIKKNIQTLIRESSTSTLVPKYLNNLSAQVPLNCLSILSVFQVTYVSKSPKCLNVIHLPKCCQYFKGAKYLSVLKRIA